MTAPLKLTAAGVGLVASFNEMAAAEFSNRGLLNHTPVSPLFWFAGLAREWASHATVQGAAA